MWTTLLSPAPTGPALATGCTSVLKVAPQTPLSALRVGELMQEAGFPAGAVNIIPGDDKCGAYVANHPGFDKIAFTGSTGVGRKIVRSSHPHPHPLPCRGRAGGAIPLAGMVCLCARTLR
eukprot:SAG22_NODE_5779_length_953_cov_1.884075_2_plen_120_part_00